MLDCPHLTHRFLLGMIMDMNQLPDAEFDEFDFMLQFAESSAQDVDQNVIENTNTSQMEETSTEPAVKRRRSRAVKPAPGPPPTKRRPRTKIPKSAVSNSRPAPCPVC